MRQVSAVTPKKLYGILPIDFKKFIKLKKGLTNEELRELLPKRYYNFINIALLLAITLK